MCVFNHMRGGGGGVFLWKSNFNNATCLCCVVVVVVGAEKPLAEPLESFRLYEERHI